MTVPIDQLAFEAMTAQALALSSTGDAGEPVEHGEVFTRRWIVDLILDLAGYTSDRDLAALVALEPACGRGAFLVPMVERLIESCRSHDRPIGDARSALRAFDLLGANALASRHAVAALLRDAGVPALEARALALGWVAKGDFLLHPHEGRQVDIVVGNPPYIRLESLSPQRNALYRDSFVTMRGRSDIFVGFLECGLRQLRPGGVLAFIVADRWMRNQYGAGLRSMISSSYAVDAVVQLHDVDAFEERVSAYPAITVVRRAKQGRVILADTTERFDHEAATDFVRWAKTSSSGYRKGGVDATRTTSWFTGPASWPTGSGAQLAVLADLESRFAPIEDASTGTRVGIGVATGADAVYLGSSHERVESDRLLPLVMAKDIAGGAVEWSGTHLVNPWIDGHLVDLDRYPRLAAYLEKHRDRICARHVAQRNARGWYRTIDRVEPGLLERPKLLLPDLKSSIHPVLEEGKLYPHHNLYFVTSDRWDLEVLGGLLLSGVANLFVGAYCVKMRGGCFRFQAQYLRRIRVPQPEAISKANQRSLASAFVARDVETATEVACRVYGVTKMARLAKSAKTTSVGQAHG